MTEDADDGAVGLLPLVDLLLRQMDQLPLPGVHGQRVAHPALDHGDVEGTLQIVRDAQIIGMLNEAVVVLGGDDDDRQLPPQITVLQGGQHTEAVQPGHVDVQQEQIDVEAAVEQLQRLHAVPGIEVFIAVAQNIGQQLTVQGGVVGDQNFFLRAHGQVLILFGRAVGGGANKKTALGPPVPVKKQNFLCLFQQDVPAWALYHKYRQESRFCAQKTY